jgi:pimeloyl-ACP methyl ester carboxylesterase
MPYADSNGVKIHYHVEGDGPAIILQHGFSGSLHDWESAGYVDALKADYTLILADTRGHGKSDKPHDVESYDMKLKSDDNLAVLDDLGIDKAHYMGYSLGGRTGYGVAKYAPERFHSIIIGGMHPYGSAGGNASVDERIEGLKKGMEFVVTSREEANGKPMPPDRRAQMLENDPQALIASSIELRDFQGIEDVLPSMTMPCLLFVGEDDFLYEGVTRCVKDMPNVKMVSFPDHDHGRAFQNSNVTLPHITKFLKGVPVK